MAVGYTISSLTTNESILEKIEKIEKYLVDNKIYNIYISESAMNNGGFLKGYILNNTTNTISSGDLVLSPTENKIYMIESVSNTFVYVNTQYVMSFDDTTISSVDIVKPTSNTLYIKVTDSNNVEYTSNTITLNDSDTTITNVAVNNPTTNTAQIVITDSNNVAHTSNTFTINNDNTTITNVAVNNPTANTAQIVITDSDNITHTSNTFNIGGGGASISDVTVNNPTTSTAQIVITDSDNVTYTSNSFNIGGNIYIDSYNNIKSINATDNNTDSTKPNINIGSNTNNGANAIIIGNGNDVTNIYKNAVIGKNNNVAGSNNLIIADDSDCRVNGAVIINSILNDNNDIKSHSVYINCNSSDSIKFVNADKKDYCTYINGRLILDTPTDDPGLYNFISAHVMSRTPVFNIIFGLNNFTTQLNNGPFDITFDDTDTTKALISYSNATRYDEVVNSSLLTIYEYEDTNAGTTETTLCLVTIYYDEDTSKYQAMIELQLAQSFTI